MKSVVMSSGPGVFPLCMFFIAAYSSGIVIFSFSNIHPSYLCLSYCSIFDTISLISISRFFSVFIFKLRPDSLDISVFLT